MKRLFIFCIALCLILPGCKKNFLDRQPQDAYSNSSLWTSEADARAALVGVYNGEYDNYSWSNGPGWADGTSVVYFDCLTDNAYSQYGWEGFQAFGNGSITPSINGYYAAKLWNYITVQKCNFFLENVDRTPMNETLKKEMIAQVRFIRAYRYFLMNQLYGGVPLVTKSVTPAEADATVRASKDEVDKFILDELTAAIPDLRASYDDADAGHITKGGALALKARLELYNKDYTACITDYQAVMAMGYDLYPSYTNLFREQNEINKEAVISVQYVENPYPNSTYVFAVMPSNSMGGQASVCPLQNLVDCYEMSNGKLITDPSSGYDAQHPYANRDPRLNATILYPGGAYFQPGSTEPSYYDPFSPESPDYYASGNNTSPTGYIVKKFTPDLNDFTDLTQSGLNVMLIRYAEVLLSYAEAKIELGQIDASVYNAINKVRKRAGMPDVDETVYNTQDKLRTLVRRERRVEFAMEGLRWYDIQRWQIGEQVMPGPVFGAKAGTVNTSTGEYTITGDYLPSVEDRQFSSKNYVWPVPQEEIDINKKLSQNPDY
ncbi:MAG: RagB/SusD family nutrient uptake outer membrane protein [Ferruginibacter sp.]